jgi:hypothetical protein
MVWVIDLVELVALKCSSVAFAFRETAFYQILFDMTGLIRRSLAYDNCLPAGRIHGPDSYRDAFWKCAKPVHEHHLQVCQPSKAWY